MTQSIGHARSQLNPAAGMGQAGTGNGWCSAGPGTAEAVAPVTGASHAGGRAGSQEPPAPGCPSRCARRGGRPRRAAPVRLPAVLSPWAGPGVIPRAAPPGHGDGPPADGWPPACCCRGLVTGSSAGPKPPPGRGGGAQWREDDPGAGAV